MFTGIIQATGRATFEQNSSDSSCLRVSLSQDRAAELSQSLLKDFFLDEFTIGESIAVNGVCLTLTSFAVTEGEAEGTPLKSEELLFDVSVETLRRSNLGHLAPEAIVNLERSLKLGDRLGGHFVQGHVDAVIQLLSQEQEGNSQRFLFSLPQEMRPFLAIKGSVTLDGISLTVGEISENAFAVYLIPHTLAQTSWRNISAGAMVNCEADCLARYTERILSERILSGKLFSIERK